MSGRRAAVVLGAVAAALVAFNVSAGALDAFLSPQRSVKAEASARSINTFLALRSRDFMRCGVH